MRQCRWVEYLKDYDFSLSYHPGLANMVIDALSRRTHVMASLMVSKWTILKDLVDANPRDKLGIGWCLGGQPICSLLVG